MCEACDSQWLEIGEMMLGIAFGTRPEWIKIEPVCVELRERNIPFQLIFTGQHKDLVSESKIMNLGATKFTVASLEDNYGSGTRLDGIVSELLCDPPGLRDRGDVTALVVQGDTSSAFAMALAAFHRQIPVIHLEAGLRTHNLEQPFPEEANRQMISCIAALHLCPTKLARDHIIRENKHLQSHGAVITGNTSLDNIKDVKTSIEKRVLVTIHRRENHEDLESWFRNIDELAKQHLDYEFLLPLHPNPNVIKYKDNMKHVRVTDPMPHQELVQYLASCEYVITDSGGIQEEAAFLRKPCMVCRKETERTEGLGNFSILCKSPEDVSDVYSKLPHLLLAGPCPYGDGHASEKVVNAIQKI